MQRLPTLFADTLKRVECGLLFLAKVIFDACAWQVLSFDNAGRPRRAYLVTGTFAGSGGIGMSMAASNNSD